MHRSLIPLLDLAFAETNPGPLNRCSTSTGVDAPRVLQPLVAPAPELRGSCAPRWRACCARKPRCDARRARAAAGHVAPAAHDSRQGAGPRRRAIVALVASVEKAFQVLEAFRDTHRAMSMAEIARAAQLDRSATQRLVHTMEQLGYVRRLPDSTLYGLAPRC